MSRTSARNGSVIVDTLTWRVVSAKHAKKIGDEYINETADGVFLIVGLQVANGKDESVTINSDQVTLEVGGKEYSTDSDGTTNLMMTEDTESFFFRISARMSRRLAPSSSTFRRRCWLSIRRSASGSSASARPRAASRFRRSASCRGAPPRSVPAAPTSKAWSKRPSCRRDIHVLASGPG